MRGDVDSEKCLSDVGMVLMSMRVILPQKGVCPPRMSHT